MDTDPLADSVPPRHAIESDEEEDEYNPLRPETNLATPIDVQVVGTVTPVPVAGLVVCTGSIGKYWARGAELGEQVAAVMVNKIQVGLLFQPKWTKAAVLVSEVTTRLPLWGMHPYARTVLEALKPKSVAYLDTYAVSTYISDSRLAYPDAPLRFLTTDTPSTALTSAAQPFAAPNLVQSTSAAFVALRAEHSASATLLLVPAPYVTPPAPRDLAPSDFSHWDDPSPWAPTTVRTAHALLFAALGEQGTQTWKDPAPEKPSAVARKRPTDTEFSMYI
ncbi:Membrane-bound transcription factor site-2 protease-like [Mycena sanguinolenta]|uniref:Membrane-bound transcription factor site-2 protease-like n=1 Tax=Mycena sanguinolenta TaxID=230812 RepID=A0A8H7DJK2_9AGAR|nr:Membrane-bound transcription factor site-2 protease-like [Mycena sanguinolenta]